MQVTGNWNYEDEQYANDPLRSKSNLNLKADFNLGRERFIGTTYILKSRRICYVAQQESREKSRQRRKEKTRT